MALKELRCFENHYYASNQRLLRLLGIWPYQKTSQRFFRVRFINFILISNIIFLICAFSMSDRKKTTVFEFLPIFLPLMCFVLGYNNILRNCSTMRKLFDRIRSDWIKLVDQESVRIMKKFAKNNKLYTTIVIVMFYLYVIFLMMPSTIRAVLNLAGIIEDSQLTLPISVAYILCHKSYFYVMFFVELWCMIVVCTVGIIHYTLYISFVQHAYGLCHIVVFHLSLPFERTSTCSQDYHWIVRVIKCYNDLTSFVDLINVIYSKTYLVEVSFGMLYVIMDYFYFFELVDAPSNTGKSLTYVIYIVVSFCMLYAICYLGQKMIDYNSDIYLKCCQIPFYMLSEKTQKVLLLLIMRTAKPCVFSMRGMIVSSHELFANIIRTSFSFATIFYNMR